MKLLGILLIIASARSKLITENECGGDVIYYTKMEKEVLLRDISYPYQLAIDRKNNTLYFSYDANSISSKNKCAYLNLITNEFGLINGMVEGRADAVDDKNNVVYLGGKYGIFKLDTNTTSAVDLHITSDSIWQLFYKNNLYYSDFNNAYEVINGRSNKVEELGNNKVQYVALDNNDNIVFSNTEGLFSYKPSSGITKIGDYYVSGFATDTDGYLYFSSLNDGIYYISDDGVKEVETIRSLDEEKITGVAVEGNGNIIYAASNSIIFIDNEWVDAKSGKTFETFNPHDGSVIAQVAEGGKADIDAAVSAAKRAFHRNSEWRLLDASQRGEFLNKFADLIERDSQYLEELESYDNGMLLTSVKLIIPGNVKRIRYLASLADKIQGDTIPVDGDAFTYTLKQPVGVCGLILPWNAPISMFLNKVATALAAGCTVVVKPAEQAPLTALYLAALLKEAGVPKGVVNVVTGFGEDAGVALTHHTDVAKISFTGSLQVGKLIQQAAGVNNLKRITLELGGKSPLVIMDDADLNYAVAYAANGVFAHQGQVCVAASRLFVQSSIYDKFVEAAVKYAQSIKIGNPADPTTRHGPQIDQTMMRKVLGYIETGKQEGAKLLTGGKRVGNQGFYIEPTVFADVTDDMTIAKEEIFGPVQSILRFDTLEEVIDRANATNYGLAAGIFTKNVTNALQFSKHVEAGTIWVNNYLGLGYQAPFGGFKESGIGRENGIDCVNAYLEVKTVTINLPKKF